MDRFAEILEHFRNRGVILWAASGQLHYRAPKGSLTSEDIERLRASKHELAALIEAENSAEGISPRLERRPELACVPLAHSQLAHWKMFRLSERPAIRQVASATRIHGQLNVRALRDSIVEMVRRHEALRTRVVIQGSVPMQEIDLDWKSELKITDLTMMPGTLQEMEVERHIRQFILEPIDVAVGPLFGVHLLKICDDEHVLIVAMEHLISDGFSLNILARDLFSSYAQISEGRQISLPQVPIQFADYAYWQQSFQNAWAEFHGKYWTERLSGCKRLRFPDFGDASREESSGSVGWRKIPFTIDRELKSQLREWSRKRHTTVVMSVLTAYIALVLRWCGATECVVRYQANSREHPGTENTIGYFASVLHLRVKLSAGDNFIDLLSRVTAEYCQAFGHADHSYLDALEPQPEYTRNTTFNWVPRGSKDDVSRRAETDGRIARRPVPFVHPLVSLLELDQEPVVLLYEGEDDVVGSVHFSLTRFSVETMTLFARGFLMFIDALLNQPKRPVSDLVIP